MSKQTLNDNEDINAAADIEEEKGAAIQEPASQIVCEQDEGEDEGEEAKVKASIRYTTKDTHCIPCRECADKPCVVKHKCGAREND